jgi:predicted component of type VI protein secretion system
MAEHIKRRINEFEGRLLENTVRTDKENRTEGNEESRQKL